MAARLQQLGLVPELAVAAAALYVWLSARGLRPRFTSARRTRQQQEVLYSRYLRGLNPYPVAVPGTSKHELGLAFDLITAEPHNGTAGAGWRSLGHTWGGQSDVVHFQLGGR